MNRRNRIHALDPAVVTLIAAGEVIERPATIVKELLENALDAGATDIKIMLEDGGRQRIFMSDNGIGIPADELELAVQRYTTSKIVNPVDLDFLQSFGFRGEALASIASMSKLTIRTRPADQEVGTELTVNHGKFSKPLAVGMTPGTQMIVSQLFAKIPARRKFLKSAMNERTAILDIVTQLAIASPETAISVTEDGKVLLSAPAGQTLLERLTYIFGEEFAAQLWSVDHHQPQLSVFGVLGSPRLARRSQPHQFVMVNRRPILSPSVSTAVREAYGSSLEPKSAPAFVLFLTVEPNTVDVNVHPRKETVLWQNERELLTNIKDVLQRHLTQHYQPEPETPYVTNDQQSPQLSQYFAKSLPQLHHTLKTAAPQWYHALATREQTVLQVHDTYLITETENGIMIVDQHAAHERILYNQFVDQFHQQLEQRQVAELSPPVVIHLSPTAAAILREQLEVFASIGCEIEPFGEQSFAVRTLPELLKEQSPQRVIESVIADIQNQVSLAGVDQLAHRTLAYLACRSAVKAGDPLTQDQARVLLEKLQHAPYGFSCPHGRPTIQTFTWNDVEKWFQRR
jgi:DNA mismatch repair protein MutL